MQRILTVEQMKLADANTIENLKIPSSELVERAGEAVANEIKKLFMGGRVLVCIGKGNNGEDGKVIAKILQKEHGFNVQTINIVNGVFQIFEKKFDIIVDCIFGIGLNKEVEGKYKKAIELINKSGAFVVACDIPSGINGNTGLVMGSAVKANLTIAIQELKLGHFLNSGKEYGGKIIAKDIGISIWEEDCAKCFTEEDVKEFFPKRKQNSHKGNFGKVAIIGGSKEFSGSVILSHMALSALKMGTGYSVLAIPNCIYDSVSAVHPEIIYCIMGNKTNQLEFDEDKLKDLMQYSALAIGMGMGVSQENYKILSYILDNYKGKLLIDADGLNNLAKFGLEPLKSAKCEVALTPHVGEFARLTGLDKNYILLNMQQCATEFAKKWGVCLIVKNAVSLITDGERVVYNTTGNSGLAKGGSGDMLSGLCLGLMCRSEDVMLSLSVASFILGKTAEKCSQEINEYSITPTDILNTLPFVVNEFCN